MNHPRDITSGDSNAWQSWYRLPAWARRSRRQRRMFPLCRSCEEQGLTIAATDADHVEPFRGSWVKFMYGELQSLCHECHRAKQNAELYGSKPRPGYSRRIGVDGFPVDDRHPFNRAK